MVLYLAGLTSIPRELYQAAEMDGAKSTWEQFKLVTWPMLGPTTLFVVTITTIRTFQVFDTIEILTKGGPSKTTYVMMYAIFEKSYSTKLNKYRCSNHCCLYWIYSCVNVFPKICH